MEAPKTNNENTIARIIVDVAFKIHVRFGPELLESVYQTVMVHDLRERGLMVKCEVPMPIILDGIKMDTGNRADILVEDLVIVELKSFEKIAYVHQKQLLTYLKVSNLKLGLLINFGAPLIKYGIKRVVNGLED